VVAEHHPQPEVGQRRRGQRQPGRAPREGHREVERAKGVGRRASDCLWSRLILDLNWAKGVVTQIMTSPPGLAPAPGRRRRKIRAGPVAANLPGLRTADAPAGAVGAPGATPENPAPVRPACHRG
jgi:hypothetical protein